MHSFGECSNSSVVKTLNYLPQNIGSFVRIHMIACNCIFVSMGPNALFCTLWSLGMQMANRYTWKKLKLFKFFFKKKLGFILSKPMISPLYINSKYLLPFFWWIFCRLKLKENILIFFTLSIIYYFLYVFVCAHAKAHDCWCLRRSEGNSGSARPGAKGYPA